MVRCASCLPAESEFSAVQRCANGGKPAIEISQEAKYSGLAKCGPARLDTLELYGRATSAQNLAGTFEVLYLVRHVRHEPG